MRPVAESSDGSSFSSLVISLEAVEVSLSIQSGVLYYTVSEADSFASDHSAVLCAGSVSVPGRFVPAWGLLMALFHSFGPIKGPGFGVMVVDDLVVPIKHDESAASESKP